MPKQEDEAGPDLVGMRHLYHVRNFPGIFTVVAHSVGPVSFSPEDPPAQEINVQVSVCLCFSSTPVGVLGLDWRYSLYKES